MEHSLARSRSRFSQGPPAHGPGAINLVPFDRSESAAVRAQHLPGASRRFHQGHATGLLFRVAAIARRAAGGAITLECGALSPLLLRWTRRPQGLVRHT